MEAAVPKKNLSADQRGQIVSSFVFLAVFLLCFVWIVGPVALIKTILAIAALIGAGVAIGRILNVLDQKG